MIDPAQATVVPQTPEEEAAAKLRKEEYDRLFEFDIARGKVDKLITHWADEKGKTRTRRNMRNIEVDVESLRRTGQLMDDDTFIPKRVINSSAEKEKPPFIAFLKQSRRAAVFKCRSNPAVKTDLLEAEYTDKMHYTGWELPFYETLDGAQIHAWASVEIEYDINKPGGVNIDGIEHDKLLFWLDLETPQASNVILREYDLTKEKLMEFRDKFGFNKPVVDELIERIWPGKEDKGDECNTTVVYKKMCKYEGIVYVFWYAKDCTGWLKDPMPLWRGKKKKVQKQESVPQALPGLDGQMEVIGIPRIVEVWENEYETNYPYRILTYSKTEEKKIGKLKGICFRDGPSQEAQTALISAYVNGVVRASNVYSSPKQNTGSGRPMVTDLILEPGKVYSEPLEFWSIPYPSPQVLDAAVQMETAHQYETGQVNFAAINREDSRKTAKEISSAEKQTMLLNSVEVTLFAVWIREIYTDAWSVTQNLARQGAIVFLPKVITTINPLGMEETTVVNDMEILNETFEVFAAGEIDVIQKAEKMQARQMMWPIISQTTLALPFLIDIIKETFPEDAERYSQILLQGDVKGQAVEMMIPILQELSKNPQAAIQYQGQFKQLADQLTEVSKQEGSEPQGQQQSGGEQQQQKEAA